MSILKPSNDTLLTMARLVFEKAELVTFMNVSFSIENENTIVVREHDDKENTSTIYEKVSVADLVASYISLGFVINLEANDAVTTGHMLGNTGR